MYQYRIWVSEPDYKSLGQHLNFFFLFNFSPNYIGTLDRAPTSTFSFYFNPFKILFLAWGVVGSNPQNIFLFVFIDYLKLSMRLWDQTPTA